jgi:alpha-N-arabinofuranosidase
VDWSGDWPIVNPDEEVGRVQATHKKPNLPEHQWPAKPARDDFNAATLDPDFNFIRTPKGDWWSLTDQKGKLLLDLIPEKIMDDVNPAFIGRRQQHKDFEAMTKMQFTPQAENETAGMVILRDSKYQVRMVYTLKDGKKVVQLIRRAAKDGEDTILAEEPVSAKELYFRISAIQQKYAFAYSTDGKNWNVLDGNVDGHILSRKWARGFTGIYIGMYASSNGVQSNNKAIFDWFEYSAQ